MEEHEIGVHQTHCCIKHGCKYGDNDCPVVSGKVRQEYLCEQCSEEGLKDMSQLLQNVKTVKGKASYKIEVICEPDEEMAQQGTPFFWCVLKWGNQGWHNVSSDWSATKLGAFRDAEWKYEVIIEEEKKGANG